MLKENGHIQQRKIHHQELKVTAIFKLLWKYFNRIITKKFKNICFPLKGKTLLCYLKFYFKQ